MATADARYDVDLPTATWGSAPAPRYSVAPPAGPAAPAERVMPTPLEFVTALQRRWLPALAFGGIVGAVAAIAVWMAMPTGKHQARALIQINRASAVLGKGSTEQDYESFRQNLTILIKTRYLLTRVLARPKVAATTYGRNADDPARGLEESIQLTWRTPEILAVTLTGDDPAALRVVLDTLIAEFLEDARSDEAKTRAGKMNSLNATKTDLTKKISAIEDSLQRLQSLGGELGTTPQSTALMIGIYTQDLSRSVAEAWKLRDAIKEQEEVAAEARRRLDPAAPATDVLDPADLDKAVAADPAVKIRLDAAVRAKAELTAAEARYAPASPLLGRLREAQKRADAELEKAAAEARPRVAEVARAARRKELEAEVRLSTERLEKLRKDAADVETQRKLMQDKIFAANKAGLNGYLEMDELRALRERRDSINRELLQLDFESRADARVQTREDAVIYPNQNLVKKLLFSGVAGCGGLVSVVAGVGYLEWRTRRVESVGQLVGELGLRVLGTVPAFPRRVTAGAGPLPPDDPWRFTLTEAVNSTRTMVLHAARAHSMQVLLVTSAQQGEAKTSLASQLATSTAGAGLRTLLIDGDLRDPSLHALFDRPAGPGLAEVLLNEADLHNCVAATQVPGLLLLPAGGASYRALAALAQGGPIDLLFNRLRGMFDVIVVDSSPALPVADALLLAQHVDGVVLSVLRGVSELPRVRSATEKLLLLSVPLLGAVFSGAPADAGRVRGVYARPLPA